MIRFTKHAQEAIDKRGIAVEWIEAAIASPDARRPDPGRPGVLRSCKAIGGRGGRVLRGSHRPDGNDV